MQEVCVGMGYCGSVVGGEPRHVDMYIPDSGPVSADQFVEWVFLAEGLDAFGSSHADGMRKAFIKHMGSEVVDAQMLKWKIAATQSSSSA
jgi:hypothetical protein